MDIVIRVILGDQLNQQHTWYQSGPQDNYIYLLQEVKTETSYVTHHIQKVAAFFTAMRLHAQWLQAKGYKVVYHKITDTNNAQDFFVNIDALVASEGATRIEYQQPDEYRLNILFKAWALKQHTIGSVSVVKVSTEHFLSSPLEFKTVFEGKKGYLMETFYRKMRCKYNILMQPNGKPEGNKWNFDIENRKTYTGKTVVPKAPNISRDITSLLAVIQAAGITTIGFVTNNQLLWPCTRQEALEVLSHFCNDLLPCFGTYEDAMYDQEPYLFHSRLSFALNIKLLSPAEVIDAAIAAYNKNADISLAQIEGFVRQIAGWREYMRNIYWLEMPDFGSLNFLDNTAALPTWYWTGDTKMKCLSTSIKASLNNAYAHHIQRLMVTGNFALLLGVHPDAVDNWYLGVYIDAIEWVEITNTRGMSQYADGGIVGTKPYISSGNYINKMSNYCKSCAYKPDKRLEENACPFNALYWAFYLKHEDKFKGNPRIGYVYNTLGKMSAEDIEGIKTKAAHITNNIETY